MISTCGVSTMPRGLRAPSIACKPGFFLPVRVLSRLFRRLFLENLAALHAAGRLAFLGDLAPLTEKRAFDAALTSLRCSDWFVYAKRPCHTHAVRPRRTAHGEGQRKRPPSAVIMRRFDRGLSELRREIVRESMHLRRWVRSRGIDGVHIDRLQYVVGKDRMHPAALELRPAHPQRDHGNPEPRLHAGHHAVSGCDLHSAVDGNRSDGARAPEGPAAATQQPGPDNAIVLRQVRQRVRNAALL